MSYDHLIDGSFDGVRFRFNDSSGAELIGGISATALANMSCGEPNQELVYLKNKDRIHAAAREKLAAGRGAVLNTTDF
ncbi:hypothetical protein [Castellaniella sp.]|uniref:hypothetical protein n=1 Tax=Castellaniella sp. TaxID=1955812 RepID=UPI003C714AF8